MLSYFLSFLFNKKPANMTLLLPVEKHAIYLLMETNCSLLIPAPMWKYGAWT